MFVLFCTSRASLPLDMHLEMHFFPLKICRRVSIPKFAQRNVVGDIFSRKHLVRFILHCIYSYRLQWNLFHRVR